MKGINREANQVVGNLWLVLKSVINLHSEKGRLQIKFNGSINEIELHLNYLQQNKLSVLVKEIITAALRSAEITELLIQIMFVDTTCYFSVKDNGLYLSKEWIVSDNGYVKMNMLVKDLQGNFNVHRGSEGMLIQVSFPLHASTKPFSHSYSLFDSQSQEHFDQSTSTHKMVYNKIVQRLKSIV
jgi:glucose-6-phosphate-specific signal transduction histidine kinase